MAFPDSPVIGQRYTAENNQEYIWTAKGSWRSVSPSGSRVKQVPYTASAVAPVGPKLGDQWFDTVARELKTWANNGEFSFWRTVASAANFDDDAKLRLTAERTLPLMWAYSEQNFTFESWSADPAFSWRDMEPIAIKRITARDDTVELATTVGIERGKRYVVVSSAGETVTVVDVVSILSPTVIRARVDFTVNVAESDKATFARTSLDVKAGYATASNGDVLFTKPLSVIQPNFKGRVRLRRSAEGTGIFALAARTPGTDVFVPLPLLETVTPVVGYRDEIYAQDTTGPVELALSYTSTGGRRERIEHLMMYPMAQAVDQRRVERPVNVTPVDQEINVGTTPTLTGNTFRSLYGLVQNGAEFQVALDAAFTNLVVNSSSDFLASWVAASFPGTILDTVYVDGQTILSVGASGRLIKSSDGKGGAIITLTPAGNVTTNLNAIDFADGATVIAGSSGVLQYSTDLINFVSVSPAGGYTGDFNGVALAGLYGLVVGTNGEIQRTVNNKGGIYAKAPADNGYVGTFVEVALLVNGRAIAVGANGEIQTSSDFGATWRKRTQAAAYSGSFTGIHLQPDGHAIAVGVNAEIQTSDDFGATWTRRAAASGYTGNFQHVKVSGRYAIAVGTGGEIQTSDNYGATWSKRTTPNSSTVTLNTVAFTPNGDSAYLAGAGAAHRPLKLEGTVVSYTVPAGENLLVIGQVYYWRVRYQDAAGFWSEYSKPTAFATKNTVNAVSAPINLSPAKGAENISIRPTLQASAFAYVGDIDTHNGSQWQISQGAQFGTVLYDSGTVAAGTSFTIPAASQLVDRQTYTWRVRYRGVNNSWGGWSTPTSFTASAKVYTPLINAIVENNARGVALQGSAFNSPVSGDALDVATVEVSKSPTFGSDVIRRVTSSTTAFAVPRHENGVDGPNSLQPDTLYYFLIRYKGTIGSLSDNSEVTTLRTSKLPVVGEAVYTTPGTYEFTVPDGITSVSAVCVGAGGSSRRYQDAYGGGGGGGGGLGWKNNIAVTPGQKISVVVGAGYAGPSPAGDTVQAPPGGSSSFGNFLTATGGAAALKTSTNARPSTGGVGGRQSGGDGGGQGGTGGLADYQAGYGGAGGAGGYTGKGGDGGTSNRGMSGGSTTGATRGADGQGGGGGGGGGWGNGPAPQTDAGLGGGVGLLGQGVNGTGGPPQGAGGTAGSGGNGNSFGGGSSGGDKGVSSTDWQAGGNGAVRVIWGPDRSFPNNAA